MPVHVNSLHEDCLLPIFDRIPLLELLHLDQVCHLWARLMPLACDRRRTLTLLLGDDLPGVKKIPVYSLNSSINVLFKGRVVDVFYDISVQEDEASLKLPLLVPEKTANDTVSGQSNGGFFTEMARFKDARVKGQLATYFADRFHYVHTVVAIHSTCTAVELKELIGILSTSVWSLNSVKLWIRTEAIDEDYWARPDQHPIRTQLLPCINQLASLVQLELNMNGHINTDFTIGVNMMDAFAFIARLKVAKLYLGWYDANYLVWDIVHRWNSERLARIGLGGEPGNDWMRAHALRNRQVTSRLDVAMAREFVGFAHKVSHFYGRWHLNFESAAKFNQFCARFGSLTELRVRLDYQREVFLGDDSLIPFGLLVHKLASLGQLTRLALDIDFGDQCHPFALFYVDHDGACGEKEARRVSLPQVKILELEFEMTSHQNFESLSPAVFPSVQVIVLKKFGHGICEICENADISITESERPANECHNKVIDSFKAKFCSPLVRIYAGWPCPFGPECQVHRAQLLDDEDDGYGRHWQTYGFDKHEDGSLKSGAREATDQ